MDNCISLAEMKRLYGKSLYINFPVSVFKFLSQSVTRSAAQLWQTLSTMVIFDEDGAVIISAKKLAQEINRTVRTVYRLLSELEEKSFLAKIIRVGRESILKVRLPVSFLGAKFIHRKSQNDENVRGLANHSCIIYNTNNNNSSENVLDPAVQSVPSRDRDVVVNFDKDVERLERAGADLDQEITAAFRETPPDYDKIRKIGEKKSLIDVKLRRLKEKPKAHPLSFTISGSILKRLKSSVPDKIASEIVWSMNKGSLRLGLDGAALAPLHAANIGIKLARLGRWETPRGMMA